MSVRFNFLLCGQTLGTLISMNSMVEIRGIQKLLELFLVKVVNELFLLENKRDFVFIGINSLIKRVDRVNILSRR